MKLESTLDRRPALLHLAPVLDVMALMLIFYLLGTTVVHHSGLSVNLPVSRSKSQLPPLSSAHVVFLSASQPPQVFFDRQQMTLEELLGRLSSKPSNAHDNIYFKADQQVSNATVTRIWEMALAAGYRVFHATQAPNQTGALETDEPPVSNP